MASTPKSKTSFYRQGAGRRYSIRPTSCSCCSTISMASRTTLARFVQGGVIPMSTNAVLCEAHRTRGRPEAAELAKLYMPTAPNYAAVMESYLRAQELGKKSNG